MTEEQAKSKWCPMVRHFKDSDNLEMTNRAEHPDHVNCIASGCMMWVEETSTNCSTGASSVCGGHCGLQHPTT